VRIVATPYHVEIEVDTGCKRAANYRALLRKMTVILRSVRIVATPYHVKIEVDTGCKRAANYRALLRKMTSRDKASYGSSPPCMISV